MRFVTGVGALGAVACLMLPAAAMSAEMRGVTRNRNQNRPDHAL